MKISYMLKREDFYSINQKTLEEFFGTTNAETKLFIYPHLNAVVTQRPSKAVKEYIYTEYSVNGSIIKRGLVWLYTRLCLNTFGLLANRTISISAAVGRDVLIYPCNRKFRIFNFRDKTVSVITKWGFSQNSLHNEINFRTKCEPAAFILPIDKYSDKTYTEHVIDGIPLARIPNNDIQRKSALKLWENYAKETRQSIDSFEYAKKLRVCIDNYKSRIEKEKPCVDLKLLNSIAEYYLNIIENAKEKVNLILSHGDLQPGNIWIENTTGKIYIIDWESVEIRSEWYDQAVLFEGIRNKDEIKKKASGVGLEAAIVTVEEILYRMNELCELPYEYGTEDFNELIKDLRSFCNV